MISRCMFNVVRREIAGSRAGALVLASAMCASAADEPKGKPQSVAVDQTRLGTALELYAKQANRTRLAF